MKRWQRFYHYRDSVGFMPFYRLILGILCVWRLTHLLNAEDGPADMLAKLRSLAGSGFWGGLLDCFYCLSIWVAAPFAYWIGSGWDERLLLWPALSGAAILLERGTAPSIAPPAIYLEDEEKSDVLLRQEANELKGDNDRSEI